MKSRPSIDRSSNCPPMVASAPAFFTDAMLNRCDVAPVPIEGRGGLARLPADKFAVVLVSTGIQQHVSSPLVAVVERDGVGVGLEARGRLETFLVTGHA